MKPGWETVTAFLGQGPTLRLDKLRITGLFQTQKVYLRLSFAVVKIKHVTRRIAVKDVFCHLWSLHLRQCLLLFKQCRPQSLRSWSCPVNICGSQLLCQHIACDVKYCTFMVIATIGQGQKECGVLTISKSEGKMWLYTQTSDSMVSVIMSANESMGGKLYWWLKRQLDGSGTKSCDISRLATFNQ